MTIGPEFARGSCIEEVQPVPARWQRVARLGLGFFAVEGRRERGGRPCSNGIAARLCPAYPIAQMSERLRAHVRPRLAMRQVFSTVRLTRVRSRAFKRCFMKGS